ncbi:DUF192 domain-containing protein [Pseudidiomarina insulisalsae]|uniref:DUF192 domain-containing protein n=1 Tax=Pseudidiomarina insulisalsae TaxID=575789 RepID=A0A432YGZ6_9GAMM|nr:DUF192 domain-containing protein [Pseudidiomarina insulisalsae]RUO60232.1 hypothetical protein CWI71_07420 [Pseudidiomarina insulisalsae]
MFRTKHTLASVLLLACGYLAPLHVQAQTDCTTDADNQCSYQTTQLCIADVPGATPMQVEIADTFGKRARGLMHRDGLPTHQGMWFLYDSERPGYSGFWMYNTRIPLDIAYLDEDLRVVKTFTMQPCTSVNPRNCPSYKPGANYWSALEMSAGYFDQYGITSGTQLQLCD